MPFRCAARPVVFTLCLAAAPLRGPCDVSPPAPTPAPPSATVSAEDEFSPSYYGENGNSNTLNLRAQLPNGDESWVLRIKLPIVTSAPPEAIAGRGDLALWDLAVIDAGVDQWLVGPTVRLPVGNDSLGSHKYSIGPSIGYVEKRVHATYGFFAQTYFSVIGPSAYPAVAKTQIAPALKIDLPNALSFGLSTMQFTYDWVINRWTDVPIGFRVGEKPLAGIKSLDGYFEAERNLARTRETPGWTLRTLLRWRFSGSQNAPSDDDADQE